MHLRLQGSGGTLSSMLVGHTICTFLKSHLAPRGTVMQCPRMTDPEGSMLKHSPLGLPFLALGLFAMQWIRPPLIFNSQEDRPRNPEFLGRSFMSHSPSTSPKSPDVTCGGSRGTARYPMEANKLRVIDDTFFTPINGLLPQSSLDAI